jgi:hypothetical protein
VRVQLFVPGNMPPFLVEIILVTTGIKREMKTNYFLFLVKNDVTKTWPVLVSFMTPVALPLEKEPPPHPHPKYALDSRLEEPQSQFGRGNEKSPFLREILKKNMYTSIVS